MKPEESNQNSEYDILGPNIEKIKKKDISKIQRRWDITSNILIILAIMICVIWIITLMTYKPPTQDVWEIPGFGNITMNQSTLPEESNISGEETTIEDTIQEEIP